MKKIFCIILALVCVLTIVSCKKDDQNTKTPEDYVNSAIASSSPTKITTNISYKKGDLNYGGRFEMMIEGENSILDYTFTRPAAIEDMAETIVITKEGTVYRKDGQYTVVGDEYDGSFNGATGFTFNMTKDNFKTFNISEANGRYTLVATVTGDKVDTVFGTDLKENGDVVITIVANSSYLESVIVTYKTASGADVRVDSTYTYDALTLNFPQ